MEKIDYEFLRRLLQPRDQAPFDLGLVDDDLLELALVHEHEDPRTAGLYLLDQLVQSHPLRAINLLNKLFRAAADGDVRRFTTLRFAEGRLRPETIAQRLSDYFACSGCRSSETLQDFQARVLSRFGFLANRAAAGLSQAQSGAVPAGGAGSGQPATQKMLLVVHGTGAANASWWRWSSPFTQYLDTVTGGSVFKGPQPFSWSGGNSDADRQNAASALVAWVGTQPCADLTIVAHSHGGNVAMLATRLGLKINRLVLLGTPIRTDYTPDLRKVDLLHNVYSFADLIQTPAGSIPHTRGEGRSLGDSDKVINHLAQGGVMGPGHSDLHDVSYWQANNFDQLLL